MQPVYGSHSFPAVQAFVEEHVHPLQENLREVKRTGPHTLLVANSIKRLGMAVHRMPKNLRSFTSGNAVIGGSFNRVTSLVSHQAWEASISKSLARAYFAAQGLPVADFRAFTPEEEPTAQEFAMSLPNAVLKPEVGRAERGLSLGVSDATSFAEAWKLACDSAAVTRDLSERVLVEPLLETMTLRCYVAGHQLVAATVMLPLFVVGDGHRSIAALVEESFQQRQIHRMLRVLLPETPAELIQRAAVDVNQVPEAGEVQVLSADTTLQAGGLPVDVTDWLHADLKELALNAFSSIPGLGAGAINIMTPRADSAEGAVLLDVDARASAQPHRYPAVGPPKKAGLAIAEQLKLRGKYWNRHTSPGKGKESALLD